MRNAVPWFVCLALSGCASIPLQDPKVLGRCHRTVLRLSDEKPFDNSGARP